MKKNLVIVGAGFAGINTYQSLPRSVKRACNITIIDKHNYFLFTPLMHEVAACALDSHNVVEPFENIVGSEVTLLQDEVTAFDHSAHVVRLKNNEDVSYDILVLALGSQTNFFNTQGAQEKSFILKDLHDTQVLRDHFINRFHEASLMESAEERKKHLHTVIVGGGPTGVELAGEASELFFHTFRKQYEGAFNTNEDARITLVNASSSLLQPFSPGSQYYAQRTLKDKGVEVMNNVRVTEINEEGIVTADGEIISTSTIVWAAGVMPQNIDCPPAVEKESNRIKVTKTLQLEDHDHVFVLGDMALAETEDGRGYPMLAQVAKQQGIQTAQNIKRLLNGEELKEFNFFEKGKLVSLGQWHAIAEIGSFHIHGPLAWLMWRAIYLVTFNSWNKRFKISMNWISNIFGQRDTTKLD